MKRVLGAGGRGLRAGGSAGLPPSDALPPASSCTSAYALKRWCVDARQVLEQTAGLLPVPDLQAGPIERRFLLAARRAARELLTRAGADLDTVAAFDHGHPGPALPTAERVRHRLSDAIVVLDLEQSFRSALCEAHTLTRRLPGLEQVLDLPSKLKANVDAAEDLASGATGRRQLGETVRDLQFSVRRCRQALEQWPATRRAHAKLVQTIEQAREQIRSNEHFDPTPNLQALRALEHADGVSVSLLELLHAEPSVSLQTKTASLKQRTRWVKDQMKLLATYRERYDELTRRIETATARGESLDRTLFELQESTGLRPPERAHAFATRQAVGLAHDAFVQGLVEDAGRHLQAAQSCIERSESDLDALEAYVRKIDGLRKRRASREHVLGSELRRLQAEAKTVRVGQAVQRRLEHVEEALGRAQELSNPLAFDEACVRIEAQFVHIAEAMRTESSLRSQLPEALAQVGTRLARLRRSIPSSGWAAVQMAALDQRFSDGVEEGETTLEPVRLAADLLDLVIDASLLQARIQNAGPDRIEAILDQGRQLCDVQQPSALLDHLTPLLKRLDSPRRERRH